MSGLIPEGCTCGSFAQRIQLGASPDCPAHSPLMQPRDGEVSRLTRVCDQLRAEVQARALDEAAADARHRASEQGDDRISAEYAWSCVEDWLIERAKEIRNGIHG